ncbi:MAG: hypothetical protein AB1762_03505 [Gemmatimonadota bacterium]
MQIHSFTRRRRGITLPQVIVWLLVLAVIVALLVFFARCISNLPGIQPSLVSILPARTSMPRGGSATFTVRVEFSGPYDSNSDRTIDVRILEDDIVGDAVLDERVQVVMRRRATVGEATFTLECDTAGNLLGRTGARLTGFFEGSTFEVYAAVQPIDKELKTRASANVAVTCVAEEEE